jgi:nucleotide-binding universal stress UspA family protein
VSERPAATAKPGAIARVVVPLDAASENRPAIDTAARLAARVRAPLHGIFVEDEDLLNLASLRFTRQTTLGGEAEQLTADHVELHLRIAADRARNDLVAAAHRHGVECSFEVRRGASAAALSVVSERDLVVAGGLTRPIGGHFRVACRWSSSIELARGPLLLARHEWSAAGSVVALLRDHGAAAKRLLSAAAQIAVAADLILTVICPPAVAGTGGFDRWLADHLAGHAVRFQIEAGSAEPAALHQRIRELDCRLLAFEAGLGEDGAERLRELAERFACDILVVR